MLEHGVPEHVRSDNGAEMTARRVKQWLASVGTQPLFIEPGSPWENGYCESFNGKLRDECLNGEIFYSLKEAQVVIEQVAEVLQHSATAQFAGISRAGAGDMDRCLADCALPFELQFADKAGRRACQGDPAGVACGHDLDNRAALLPIPMRSSKGRGGTSVCEPATVRFGPTATFPARPSLSPKLLGPITPRYTLCRTGTKYRAGHWRNPIQG